MTTEHPRQRKVLLVDDDKSQYLCMRELFGLFRGEHYALEWAPTFGEGLVALLSGNYVACILDYQLGERTGIELLQQANVAQCHTPIILVTGWSAGDIDLEAINAGALDYLVKGEINPRILERSLRYAIKMSETMAALRQAATEDEVTGLYNRRALDRMLEEECQRTARFNRAFSLTLIDLDLFKRVNDTHGHQVGDQVLRHVASLLAGQVRSIDKVARYGGEEFAIVQIETECQGAFQAAQRLQALLSEIPFTIPQKGLVIPVTLSAGVATFPKHGRDMVSLVEAADAALYEAKARGRNRVVSADELPPPPAEAS